MSYSLSAVSLCLALVLSILGTGCGSESVDVTDGWSGSIDTLASGEVVVRNIDEPLWLPEETWRVVEEVRIGSETGDDAILFGDIRSFDVDMRGRVYALDGQAEQIHVFDPSGSFVRTVGTRGTGPGEFEGASSVDVSLNGEIWVVEMMKGRLSILDSTGQYTRSGSVNSRGRFHSDYPGGFDRLGRFNAAILSDDEDNPKLLLARFDQSFTPLDTIPIPESPQGIEYFEHVSKSEHGTSTMQVQVPYQGSFDWSFSSSGNFWTLLTGTYELVELTKSGKALRKVVKEFEPILMADAERESLRKSLAWFTEQGGELDMSRIPKTKPVVLSFFSDDEDNLWVMREVVNPDDERRLFHLFDSRGRFLGPLQLPFALRSSPEPIVRDGMLYGVTTDDLGAEIIVRARIEKP